MTEPKWATWSCDKCEVKVALRANSKGDAKHWCKRQSGKYLPLIKEVPSDTKDPNGGGGPAGSSPGSDARTERQDQRFSDGTVLPDPPVWTDLGSRVTSITDHGDYVAYGFRLDIDDHLTSHGIGNFYVRCPSCNDLLDRELARGVSGSRGFRRDLLAASAGFRSYQHFLSWCDDIIAGD